MVPISGQQLALACFQILDLFYLNPKRKICLQIQNSELTNHIHFREMRENRGIWSIKLSLKLCCYGKHEQTSLPDGYLTQQHALRHLIKLRRFF